MKSIVAFALLAPLCGPASAAPPAAAPPTAVASQDPAPVITDGENPHPDVCSELVDAQMHIGAEMVTTAKLLKDARNEQARSITEAVNTKYSTGVHNVFAGAAIVKIEEINALEELSQDQVRAVEQLARSLEREDCAIAAR